MSADPISDRGQVLGESLIAGIHDRLPIWQYAVYGIQMLIADGLTALVLPVVLGRALKLGTAEVSTLVAASLLAAGLVTVGQSLVTLRLPVLQGPAVVFVAIVPLGVVSYGIDAMWTAMWIGGLLIAVLSWPLKVLPRLRKFISQPAIYGTFIIIVALVIGKALFGQIVGRHGSPHYGAGSNFLIAAIPFVLALLAAVFLARSRWRTIVLLVGAGIATGVAALFGQIDFGAVAGTPWLRAPNPFPFGFAINGWAILLVFVGYFANLFEGIGVYKVFCEDIGHEPLTDKRVAGGIFTEGIGSAIGGIFGGMGATTYAQNMGSIAVTRVGTRFQVTAAGLVLVLLAFVSKLATAVASLPGPVVGGLLFATVSLLLLQGMQIVGSMPKKPANLYAVGAGVLAGGIWMTIPTDVFAGTPSGLRPFVSSGLIVGLVIAIVVNIVFDHVAGALRPGTTRGSSGTTGKAVPNDTTTMAEDPRVTPST